MELLRLIRVTDAQGLRSREIAALSYDQAHESSAQLLTIDRHDAHCMSSKLNRTFSFRSFG